MAAIAHRLRCEVLEARRMTAVDVADSVNVSVQSDGLAGLRAAEIHLNYDTRALTLSDSDIQVGKAWEGSASLVTKVDDNTGSVNIFLFSTEPLVADAGGLVDVKFQLIDQLAADVAMATLSRVQLNEGLIEASATLTTTRSTAVPVVSESTSLQLDMQNELNAPSTSSVRACGPWASDDLPRLETAEREVSESDIGGSDSEVMVELITEDSFQSADPIVASGILAAPLIEARSHWAFDDRLSNWPV